MKNIQIIDAPVMEQFLLDLWKSPEFIYLQKNNSYFKLLAKKLQEAPVFFYELSHPKGRNHLTSIFRFIAKREYDNSLIQDLYYFHELCHCAQYQAYQNPDYFSWSQKLSMNELYASLFSEVFIYFFQPSLIGQTFAELWAQEFTHQIFGHDGFVQNEFGFYYDSHNSKDVQWNHQLQDGKINLFSLNLINWPVNIQQVFMKRQYLRSLDSCEGLTNSESIIVNYNLKHQKWINCWKEHYQKIDNAIISLYSKQSSSEEYKNYILTHCDEFGRPFFPK